MPYDNYNRPSDIFGISQELYGKDYDDLDNEEKLHVFSVEADRSVGIPSENTPPIITIIDKMVLGLFLAPFAALTMNGSKWTFSKPEEAILNLVINTLFFLLFLVSFYLIFNWLPFIGKFVKFIFIIYLIFSSTYLVYFLSISKL